MLFLLLFFSQSFFFGLPHGIANTALLVNVLGKHRILFLIYKFKTFSNYFKIMGSANEKQKYLQTFLLPHCHGLY